MLLQLWLSCDYKMDWLEEDRVWVSSIIFPPGFLTNNLDNF